MRTLLIIISSIVELVFWQNRTNVGLLIVARDTMQGGIIPLTNFVVMKIETNATRVDIGSALSVITMPASSEEVQLFHQTKTYQWQTIKMDSTDTNPLVPLPLPVETTFDGHPAKLYCFTNAVEFSHVWVSPRERFLKSPTNFVGNPANIEDLTKLPQPGSVFDSDSIVVGTEYGAVEPVPLSVPSAGDNSQPQFTNVVITQTSRLISMAETNFDPAIFVPPTNYVEGYGNPQQTAKLEPLNIPQAPAAQANFKVLRKQYQNGSPLLPAVHFGP